MSFSDKSWTTGKITVPDGISSLGAVALVMSENFGLGFTPVPEKVIKTQISSFVPEFTQVQFY